MHRKQRMEAGVNRKSDYQRLFSNPVEEILLAYIKKKKKTSLSHDDFV